MRRFRLTLAAAVTISLSAAGRVHAGEGETGTSGARPTVRQAFSGPFTSSHLFAMPTADVVGPFQLSVAGEASLLSESNTLSGGGLAAIGFGDVAQLEYRVSAAFSNSGEADLLLPSLGVQLKAPFRERRGVPALAVALRLGLPRTTELDDGSEVTAYDQRVNDLYVVGRIRLWGPLRGVTLHGGLRVGAASLKTEDTEVSDVLFLPAGGWELQMNPSARLIGELALVPVFDPLAENEEDRITAKPFGRLGVRWFVHPAFAIDASLGYRIEIVRFMEENRGSLDDLIGWDIRLGAEFFVPWGALVCRTSGHLCK
jgi:hypothetical protein